MTHVFNVEIARRYGLLEAVIINNIDHWIAYNNANGKNIIDGDCWTYNSAAAFSTLFPYATKRQIELALKHLRDEGILKTGNFNEKKWDRTLWYTFTKKGFSMLHECDMDYPDSSQPNYENVIPIPYNNHISNPNVKQHIKNTPYNPPVGDVGLKTSEKSKSSVSRRKKNTESYDIDGFTAFWAAYPKKIGKAAALKAWNKLKPDVDLQERMGNALEVQKNSLQWRKDNGQYIPMASTWLNGKRWEDELPQEQNQTDQFDRMMEWAVEYDNTHGGE